MNTQRANNDYQFNPALWTRRIDPERFVPAHVEFATQASDTYRQHMRSQNGLSTRVYGTDSMRQEMDVFRPSSVRDDASIVVYIHGGWWQWFSKEMFSYVAQPFNEAGYTVFMPGYTLAQDWKTRDPMTCIIEQLELAMLEVFREAERTSAKHIALVGHSAGGHLVSMLRKTDWAGKYDVSEATLQKLSHVFSLAGLFDIQPLVHSYVNDAIGMTEAMAERVSPSAIAPDPSRSFPPLHLILPEFDSAEFFRQTKAYQQHLIQAGERCHLKVLSNQDHISMIESVLEVDAELMTYIMRCMG